jgi:hypothetical protein
MSVENKTEISKQQKKVDHCRSSLLGDPGRWERLRRRVQLIGTLTVLRRHSDPEVPGAFSSSRSSPRRGNRAITALRSLADYFQE